MNGNIYMHNGITIEHKPLMQWVNRHQQAARLAWVVRNPSGQEWGFKTRHLAEAAIDQWVATFVGRCCTDMRGRFFKYTIVDGAIVEQGIDRQEWLVYITKTREAK